MGGGKAPPAEGQPEPIARARFRCEPQSRLAVQETCRVSTAGRSAFAARNVIEQLMGGSPEAVATRYAHGSPVELLPLGVRQVLIVGVDDGVMPPESRDAYKAAASKAGDAVEVIEVPGGHFEVIAPTSTAWPTVRDKMLALVK